MRRTSLSAISRAFILVSVLLACTPAGAVDWTKVPAKDLLLMYPAQIGWERLFAPGFHSGQRRYLEGKNCASCHLGQDEIPLGRDLVVAEKYEEPTPIARKPGWLKASVKTAHDADTIYFQLEFDAAQQPDAGQDKVYEVGVSLILDDGGVPDAKRAGCWAACHVDSVTMMRSDGKSTMYLLESRDGPDASRVENREAKMKPLGNFLVYWDQFLKPRGIKPDSELAKLRTAGHYLEYWQARVKPDASVVASDGTILEKRTESPKPAVTATASRNGTVWTVTLARKLKAGAPYKDIVPGKIYNVGFAVHAGHTNQRFHYVAFERTLALDKGPADLVAAGAP